MHVRTYLNTALYINLRLNFPKLKFINVLLAFLQYFRLRDKLTFINITFQVKMHFRRILILSEDLLRVHKPHLFIRYYTILNMERPPKFFNIYLDSGMTFNRK